MATAEEVWSASFSLDSIWPFFPCRRLARARVVEGYFDGPETAPAASRQRSDPSHADGRNGGAVRGWLGVRRGKFVHDHVDRVDGG